MRVNEYVEWKYMSTSFRPRTSLDKIIFVSPRQDFTSKRK